MGLFVGRGNPRGPLSLSLRSTVLYCTHTSRKCALDRFLACMSFYLPFSLADVIFPVCVWFPPKDDPKGRLKECGGKKERKKERVLVVGRRLLFLLAQDQSKAQDGN